MKIKRLLFLLILTPFLGLSQQDSIQTVTTKPNENKSIQERPDGAPVVFKSDTIFYVLSEIGNYNIEERAIGISKNLKKITKNYNASQDSLYLVKKEGYYELMFNDEVAFVVTQQDADKNKMPMAMLADIQLGAVDKSLNKVESLTPIEWLKRIGYFVLSFLILFGFFKLINWFFRRLDERLSKIEKSFLKKNKNILKYFIPKDTVNIFVFLSKIVRIGLLVLVLFIYAPFMFSFFPWAERIVDLFYGYISTPIKSVFFGFINYIPSLFFVIVIAIVSRYMVRVLKDVATDVELGKFKLPNFHKDWAQPTAKIFSILIYAISLVFAYPHLPGSESAAFQGVSIFIGAIISFGSTSAIANIIAGIVITYMRPFQIGDRVKIDSLVGDIIGKTILVTHLRTPKDEDVTIPNANILIGNITNYTKSKNRSILLYTTITLGYDLPWQTAEKLLLDAASKVELVLKDPKPFVLQTSLDDYYVSYELNIACNKPKKMPLIYSEVHKSILEVFNEAGVEILSPAYTATRDGNLTTVPSQLKDDDKSPINRLVDHLTGRNQKITITKREGSDED